MIIFNKTELRKMFNNIRTNISEGKGYTKQTIKDTNGEKHKLSKRKIYGLLQQWNLYIYNHYRQPKFVTYNGKAKEPIIINYQDNKYQCACASFNMCIQGFGDWINEGDIAEAFNTGVDGTSPSDMILGAMKLGYEVKIIPRNIDGVQTAKEHGYGVIAHIDTIKAPSLGYLHNYGHYVCISRITKAGNYRVFDPTKGVHSIKPVELDHAMLDREINYYSVRPI